MTEEKRQIKHLVIDSGVLIKNPALHTLAEKYYAPPQIVNELRSAEVRKIWNNLVFEVVLREPSQEALRAVIDASKTTGDFQSLSLVDIKMIALTWDLHQQYVKGKEEETVAGEESEEKNAEKMKNMEDLEAKIENCKIQDCHNSDDVANEAEDDDTESSEEEDDDESGWITQDNIDETLKKLGAFEIQEDVIVGCTTTDFALQNVLIAMNLGLVSLLGMRIKKLKSYVLRCRTCYTTTSVMTKEFCPSCGYKTLHKCPISVDEDGVQHLHINWKRLANRRGLVYTLANPKGGKHAVNEKLFEDQPMPHMRMARMCQDPLDDGPFAMHDVSSKSAQMGIHTALNRTKQNRNRNEAKRGGRRK